MRKLFKVINNRSKNRHQQIAIIAVGGAGANILETVLLNYPELTEFVSINRHQLGDQRSIPTAKRIYLNAHSAEQIGPAIECHWHKIHQFLKNKKLLIILTGLGGVVGTYASPLIAEIATDLKIPTTAFIIRPFNFEGEERLRLAKKGEQSLIDAGASIVSFSNQDLIKTVSKGTSMLEAFSLTDQEALKLIETSFFSKV